METPSCLLRCNLAWQRRSEGGFSCGLMGIDYGDCPVGAAGSDQGPCVPTSVSSPQAGSSSPLSCIPRR